MHIDFTMTATCRPEIVARTLESFSRNLTGVDLFGQTLHLNVDPLPAGRPQRDVVEVCERYFHIVDAELPATPSFPVAVKWCFMQSFTSYFFHLEDDWELTEPVDLNSVVKNFHPDLTCINLRAYDFPPGDRRLCLSPGLWRANDAAILSDRMTLTANPEKQLRPKHFGNPEGGKHEGFAGGQFYPDHVVLRDIGRDWLSKSGYRKNGYTSHGENWWTAWEVQK